MRRGALDRLGLGYEALKEAITDIVYCLVTGFGPGEDQDRPGYDFLVQARSGIMGISGFPDGEPTKVGVAIADMVFGLQAAMAILAALHLRSLTGEGAQTPLTAQRRPTPPIPSLLGCREPPRSPPLPARAGLSSPSLSPIRSLRVSKNHPFIPSIPES
jgi:hypothetical protein